MPPLGRWRRWAGVYALLIAFGVLAGGLWAVSTKPDPEASHTTIRQYLPGEKEYVPSPVHPTARPSDKPVYVKVPGPTVTTTEKAKKPSEKQKTGPGGRGEVMPSGSTDGGSTGSSPAGGADAGGLTPPPEPSTEPTMTETPSEAPSTSSSS